MKSNNNSKLFESLDFLYVPAPNGFIELMKTNNFLTQDAYQRDPQRVFEHEWHIAPNPSLPDGEPQAIIHWELEKDGDSGTLLTLNHSHLTRSTSRNFAPGWHAYLDRLEASLNNEVLPDWTQRFGAVKKLYPS